MPFFKSMPDDAGPANVFTAQPDIFGPWSAMSQVLMNGPSPLTPGEREMIAAYVVGVAGCEFAYVAHCEAAYAWGIEDGTIDRLLESLDAAAPKFRPLFAFVKKLTLNPGAMDQADADGVFDAGWNEKALGDAIAVTARMCFMQRLVEGYGFTQMPRDKARQNARKRVDLGYVDLYPEFADRSQDGK